MLKEYENAQKNFYAIGAEIAKREANLQNIIKSQSEIKDNLEKAYANYEKAKATEKNFDELSPSEKAMHILDEIKIQSKNTLLKLKILIVNH